MMTRLIARGEQLARQAQARRLQQVAERLRSSFGSAAIEADKTQVFVSGKGVLKRWLADPRLRFLSGVST